ncbi:hypothetical protein [Xenorhabdus szentirmaii]|uniref:Methyl transferase n=1 Tax=Xenorhabdus szentirmaii DSM 16338 TaxID=1427518 RepID=W1J1N7_9GAMM
MKERTQYDYICDSYESLYNSVLQWQTELTNILKMAGDIEVKSVLDLACGCGYFGHALSQRGQ